MTKRTKLWLALPVVLFTLALAGCPGGAKAPPPHPNQLNTFDGATYDTLTAAQSAINEAKAQFKAGALPASAKPIINKAAASYNTAEASWKLWRDIYTGAKAGDQATAQAKVSSDLTTLNSDVTALKGAMGK